jgi:c-di-GMP-binding flagellar brake protein YcgR
MARSLPQPDDLVARTGLSEGLNCWLEYREEGEEHTASSHIHDISALRITVSTPTFERVPIMLPEGTWMKVFFASKGGKHFCFNSQVLGYSPQKTMLYIKRPVNITEGDRRRAFRLDIALTPAELFTIVVDSDGDPPEKLARISTIIDLSEGGCCISTRAALSPGQRLGMRLDLPGAGTFTARMVVRSIESPQSGMRNRRVHCQFQDLDPAAKGLILKYLLRRQRELRARGQL